MFIWIQSYLDKIKPVMLDGALYMLIALFGSMEMTFSSDEAYKYMNPSFKFWSAHIVGWALACVSALKMFRSTSYGEHLESKKKASETTFTNK